MYSATYHFLEIVGDSAAGIKGSIVWVARRARKIRVDDDKDTFLGWLVGNKTQITITVDDDCSSWDFDECKVLGKVIGFTDDERTVAGELRVKPFTKKWIGVK